MTNGSGKFGNTGLGVSGYSASVANNQQQFNKKNKKISYPRNDFSSKRKPHPEERDQVFQL